MEIANRRCRWVTILVALALLGWCAVHDPTPDYRYRLTVEVDTPKGSKTGSSVIEVETRRQKIMRYEGPGARYRLRGEAVAVELPGGKTLFALLRSENDSDWGSDIMFQFTPKQPNTMSDPFQARFDLMLEFDDLIVLPHTWPAMGGLPERSAYPMLVTFGNLADPSSVELIDPDDLAATFGKGVRLKRITVQMTDDPVTTGIEKRLAWLGQIKKMGLANEDFPEDLHVGDFSGLFRKPN